MKTKNFLSLIIFFTVLVFLFSCIARNGVKDEVKPNLHVKQSNEKELKKSKTAGASAPIYTQARSLSCMEEDISFDDGFYFQFNDREKYKYYGENPRTSPIVQPTSTFSIDVDTGSYSNARRFLQKYGQLPPEDSIRIEEFINYFNYNYPLPKNKPFSIYHELAVSPFDKDRLLLHIGIQGKKVTAAKRPDTNLVFLIDVSGSMDSPDKLGLLKSSLLLLTDQMTQRDKVSIAVYAGAAGMILPPTNGNDKSSIKRALKSLSAGGSTAGSQGILLAYELAEKAFINDGINRVILATDGDFNVGMTNFEDLIELIEKKRESGISLTTLGFGTGNYNDRLMEQLANKGNGNYFYIDNLNEAKKVLVDELSSTLQTIAKDVKIQIEFNPKYIFSYRLIGYENRKLKKEDFDNDKIDAGDIGAGHTVTAIYELTLTDSKKANESSRYTQENKEIKDNVVKTNTKFEDEIAFFRLRYKKPNKNISSLIENSILRSDIHNSNPTNDFIFSSAVAHFAEILRKSEYAENYNINDVLELVKNNKGEDNWGYRRELESLIELAKSLKG